MKVLPGWRKPAETWTFIVDLMRAATEPRADVAWCDAQVAALAAGSAIGRALSRLADACGRATDGSAVVGIWRRSVLPRVPQPIVDRLRAAGVVSAIAAVTTLLLRNATTERDPLTWVLPAAVAVAGIVTAAAARPLARAIADYRS